MVYYHEVCPRKLWYFIHGICLEQENENVAIGKILDEETYRDEEKHINIDNVINIDFIRSLKALHEVKKSRKIEKASILQVQYYLYYLKHHGVEGFTGRIDYPLLKKSLSVELTHEDEKKIEETLASIEQLGSQRTAPPLKKKGICSACAYADICFI